MDGAPASVPGGGPDGNYAAGGGSAGGFHNISSLPLGSIFKSKQQGRAKKKGPVGKLLERGFK